MIDGHPQTVSGHRHDGELEPNWKALLLVAYELQRWVDALPVWSVQSSEDWSGFSRRHAKGEQVLAGRLRRMPGCTIARSTNGATTTLILAGVEARAQGGLAAACRNWIAKVQRAALALSRTPR
jgi:hypothetical protein